MKILSIIVNFINDKTIKIINKNYLNHNYVTDILTFPYLNDKSIIDGEMFISLDSVKKNSKYYINSYLNECKRVIIHGCLHLAGYNDKTKKQIFKIRTKENYYLSK